MLVLAVERNQEEKKNERNKEKKEKKERNKENKEKKEREKKESIKRERKEKKSVVLPLISDILTVRTHWTKK